MFRSLLSTWQRCKRTFKHESIYRISNFNIGHDLNIVIHAINMKINGFNIICLSMYLSMYLSIYLNCLSINLFYLPIYVFVISYKWKTEPRFVDHLKSFCLEIQIIQLQQKLINKITQNDILVSQNNKLSMSGFNKHD